MAKCREKFKYISKSHYNLNGPSWSARTEDSICEMDTSHHHLWGQPELLMWGRVSWVLFSLISRLMHWCIFPCKTEKCIINTHGSVLIVFHISKKSVLEMNYYRLLLFWCHQQIHTTVSLQNLPLLRELLSPSCCHEQKNAIKHRD